MAKNRIEFVGLTPAEIRAFLFKAETDHIMLSAQAYEKENNQVKADEQWAKWTVKRQAIRDKYPDV